MKTYAKVESSSAPLPPLRAMRQARGLSLRQVSEKARVDIGQLSRAERGQAGLSITALRRVARVLGLTELNKMLEPFDQGERR